MNGWKNYKKCKRQKRNYLRNSDLKRCNKSKNVKNNLGGLLIIKWNKMINISINIEINKE